MQKLIPTLVGQNRVIPLWENRVSVEADLLELFWGELDPLRVVARVERAGDGKPGGSTGLADEAQDGGVIDQRLTGPAFADLGKEPMLDGIPLGGAGGIMTDGDEQPEAVREFFLQRMLPEIGVGPVAAAVVGEDEQARGVGIALASLPPPPLANRLGGERRSVAGGADVDAAAVGLEIIHPIRDGDASSQGGKIMVMHLDWRPTPNPAGVLEPANQFALLGVDADDGRLRFSEAPPLALEVAELPVAFRTRGAEALAVGMQSVAELFQQTPHGVGRGVNAQPAQQAADLAQPQSGPHSPSSHGIAGGIRCEQRAQRVQELGRFFSRGLRPPPARRTRSLRTFPTSSSRRPRATVATSNPSSAAMRWSPP